MGSVNFSPDRDEEVLGPDHPLVCGPVPPAPPLSVTAPLVLNTYDLSWEAVEHLVVTLALKVDGAREARLFGRRGQNQHGIDVVAFFDEQPTSVYQAKRYAGFTAGDLRKAVISYADGRRPFQGRRLVVVTTADVADTKIDEELAALREKYRDLTIELWGQKQLSDHLYEKPDVVLRFFGEATMQLFCRHPAVSDRHAAPHSTASTADTDDYLEQLANYVAIDLHELVPTALMTEGGEGALPSTDLISSLRPGRHVQLVGPSGAGKSHALAHLTIQLAQSGWLPILLRAGVYEGQLEQSVDEAVAPFSGHRAAELINAAQTCGRPVVLLVDAVNESPSPLTEHLMQQLSAWCRRTQATVVLSGQEVVRGPGPLAQAKRLYFSPPDADQRLALLRCYGAEHIVDRCEAFSTSFELSLAARLAEQLPVGVGKGGLLDAFVRDRLRTVTHPLVVRQVLRRWAWIMDERLMGWLPVADAERIGAQVLAEQGLAISTIEEALGCSALVEVRQQRVAFRHELFGRLLVAEHLLLHSGSDAELAGELARPQHQDLATLALPMESEPGRIRHVLATLQESKLLAQALRGQLGPAAEDVVAEEARRLLAEATAVMNSSRVEFIQDLRYRVVPHHTWDSHEIAIFDAVGITARDGWLVPELVNLLRATDAACRRGAEQASEQYKSALPSLIAAALDGATFSDMPRLPADIVMHAIEFHRWTPMASTKPRHPSVGAQRLNLLLSTAQIQDVGVPLLLCRLLRFPDEPEVARLAPRIVSLSWATGAGHLRLAALDLATSVRDIADADTTARIIDVLQGLTTDDLWQSTALIDALNIYALIESPYAADHVREEIAEVLAHPEQPSAHDRAVAILSNQFEDAIAAPFVEAIAALDETDRTALQILAVREGDTSLYTDLFLKELLRSSDSAALPAFRYWADAMDLRSPFRQDAVNCHILGILGCAAHTDLPPDLLTGHQGPDAEAWRCYGQMIFWLHRPGQDEEQIYEQCHPLWAQLTSPLQSAAADPLHQLHRADYSTRNLSDTVLGRILRTFPHETRQVLHQALADPDGHTSLFPQPSVDARTATTIQLLGIVGDASSLPHLTPYLDHSTLGTTAVAVIRQLKSIAQ